MRRVTLLVVEDDEKFAADLTLLLVEEGYSVLGPATNVAEALRILDGIRPDAALLDCCLGDSTSEPLLPVLKEYGVPVCLGTGTMRSVLPLTFADLPILQKPFSPQDLLAEVESPHA